MVLGLISMKPVPTLLEQVQDKGEITVIGVSGPTTFFQQAGNARGFQYELARRFADDLGVRLVITEAPDTEAVLRAISKGQADVAITGLTSDDPRLKRLNVSHPYLEISQQLISRSDRAAPESFASVDRGTVVVPAGSAAAQTLHQIARDRHNLRVLDIAQGDPITLLDLVNARAADYAVLNSNEFEARRALFPDLTVATTLSDSAELAWAFSRSGDDSVAHAAQRFFDKMDAAGTLDRLAGFYGQQRNQPVDDSTLSNFQHDITSQLPRYRKLFEQNAKRNDMDWRLLAAIAYQESKWQADAVSPTGVEGIMMLTQSTAEYMDVENRANANQSIRGGAAYYREIADGIPESVREPDRTWMALAAYNMGPAWIDRARTLTDMAGENPDRWLDVSRQLRAMAIDARRNGRAGPQASQALLYVQEVRRYYDTLLLTSDNDIRVAMNTPRQHALH
jgi:membrane-bound lytic murein transglycosylase F